MDPIIYLLAEHFPWWGLPTSLIFFELFNTTRRRGKRKPALFFAFMSLIFFSLSVLYFTNNGFFNVRPALQNIEDRYKK